MLMEQIDKHADLMAHILAGIAGGMVTKSMRDFIVKAAARRPGEVWQTNGRWYRKEGTRTVRIPKPGSEAEKKPAKAPKQAKPSKADLYASAKEAVAKLRGGDPGSIDEAMASLSALTVPELRKLAKESGLTKVSGRLKREIVEGLRDGIKASGGSVAGEPGTPSDAKAIKLTSEPIKELASEVAEKHGATVKGGELHTTYAQALEMISTLQDAESHFTAISKPGQAAKARWLIDALRLKHDLRPYLGTGIGGEKHRGTRLDPSFASIDPAFSARTPGHGGLSYVVGIEPVEGSKTQDGKVFRGGKWVEEGPKEGDRNEDGLVFRNGRWHREEVPPITPPVVDPFPEAVTPEIIAEADTVDKLAEAKAKIEDFGEKIGGARKDKATKQPKQNKPSTTDPEIAAWKKRYSIAQVASSMRKEEEGKWSVTDTKDTNAWGSPRQKGLFDSKEDAEKALPLLEVARNHRVNNRGTKDEPNFVIYRVVTNRKLPIVKEGFKTEDEAMKYMATNPIEIIETKVRIDDSIHPQLEIVERNGKDYRGGKPATPEMFKEFGFRGVEFGNWNNQAERQVILNHAYDSFRDLADMLGIDPKAISLNGELALGFGSRGHGLTGARAHYERDYGAINLTKLKGAGALAHEWMHALDHHLARKSGKAPSEKVANESGHMVYRASTNKANDFVSHGHPYEHRMAKDYDRDVAKAFDTAMDAIQYRTVKYTEDKSLHEKRMEKAGEQLENAIQKFRDELTKDYTKEKYTRLRPSFQKPASAEVLAKVDALLEKVRKGEAGETVALPTKAKWGGPSMPQALADLNALHHEVRGRNAWFKDNNGYMSGTLAEVNSYYGRKGTADTFLQEAKELKEKEKKVATEFYSHAKRMDDGTVSDYWSEWHELGARAFESYIYDKIKESGDKHRNDFLAYEKHNNLPEYRLFGVKPYPEGEERKDINVAFDKLFEAIREKHFQKANDEGPRDGDVNADGLVFRNGRWHRDDNLEVIEPVSEKPGPTPAVTDTITVEEPDERAAESADGRRAELERTGSGDAPRTGRRDSRILTDREQHTGPANLGLVPEHLRQHLREHQQFGVAKCIAAMDAHGGVLNADGTGVGKSRENLAVADYYARQGKKVVIVAPKGVIKCDWKKGTYAGSYKQDGEAMGVVPVLHGGDSPLTAGQIAMTTYDRIGKLKEHVGTDTVVIFDESHALKNSNSQRGKHGRDIMFKADKVLYATASPADKPLHVAHLLRAGVFGGGDGGKFWGKSADTYRKLGLREEEIYNRHSGQTIKKWGVDPRVGHAGCARRMSGLFDQMTKDGLMFQRSLSMDNVDASVHHVQLSSEAAAEVEAAFNRSMSDNDGNKAVAIMAMRRAQEPHKIAAVVDHVKTELAAGRAPIIFLNRVNDNVEDDNDEDDDAIPDENTARLLREALIAAGIPEKDIGELHGAATKTPDAQRKAMDHFNGGKTKVLISTLQSGGVGVNLDDTVGDRPRTIVMMTPPLSANDMLQAAGRINRLSTMSDAKIISLVSDHKVDQWNMKLLGKKMKTMGAVLGKGFDVLLDGGEEVVEPEPFDWGGSLIRSQRSDTPKAATQTVSITGNTFDHKDRIRAAGGRWNADLKAWSIPVDKVESIRNLRGLNFSDQPQPPPIVRQQPTQDEPPTPKYISQAQKEAIHQSLQQLAGNDPDRARERNSVGFNKMDSEFGTTLANSPSLTDRQAEAGAKLLAKYHRQLSPELHARATTFDERPEGMPFSNPPDVTTAPNATKYHVSGNTFAHKDRIRAAGGKWDGANKVWVIPASAKDRIANLPGLKFTGKRLKSPIYVMKAMGEQSESLAMLDALADILGGLYGKDALKHIPGLNRTPISKTYCILDGEVYRWSDGMLYKRLGWVWKASRHKPGEEWETRGRFYRREQGRTVRISKPGGKAIAVASDGAAEGTQTAAPKASKESAREAAKAKIAEIAKGGKSPESHKELMANLGKLTVVDLKAIAKEHNLKAPPRLKAALMQKLADHIGLKKTDPVSYEAIRKMRLEHAGTKEATGPRSEPTVDVAKFHAQLDSLLAESPKERKVKPVEKEKLRARNASDMLTEPESLMPANAKKKAKQAPSEDDIKLDLPVIKTPIRAKARA